MSIFSNFYKAINDKNNKIDYTGLIKSIFKEVVDENSAVVQILSSRGIAGFKFNVPEREEIKLRNEVTDFYLEDNEPVQDHVARKPVEITLTGLQGDYFYTTKQIERVINEIIPTLSLIKTFLPEIQSTVQKVKSTYNQELSIKKNATLKDKVNAVWQTTNTNGGDLYSLFTSLFKLKSAQTRAYFFFEALWRSEAKLTVETTWKTFENMVITNVSPIRDNNADITDFSVSFKQLNFTSSKKTKIQNAAGRTAQQKSEVQNNGIDKGQKVEVL